MRFTSPFMTLADFDFHLPEDRIALRPASPRDSARLLLVEPAAPLRDLHVSDLPGLLRAGDVLVVNDTRVIPARLRGVRRRGETRHAKCPPIALIKNKGRLRGRPHIPREYGPVKAGI